VAVIARIGISIFRKYRIRKPKMPKPAMISIFRAMLYVERGYATVCRPSVRPFVCDVQPGSGRPMFFSHTLEYFENNFTAD